MKRAKPNNYFHVRVYTDDGSKIELYRDRKQPSTRKEIVDGLRRAIEVIEKIDASVKKAVLVVAILLVASSAHAADRRPLTALVAASVADGVSTELAIARVPGAYESNPLLSGSQLQREVSKAACTAGLVWGLAKLSQQHPRLASALAWTATGSLAIVAAHNAAIGGR